MWSGSVFLSDIVTDARISAPTSWNMRPSQLASNRNSRTGGPSLVYTLNVTGTGRRLYQTEAPQLTLPRTLYSFVVSC